jgi:hypothetical protein
MSGERPRPSSADLYRRLLSHVWPYGRVLAAGIARWWWAGSPTPRW